MSTDFDAIRDELARQYQIDCDKNTLRLVGRSANPVEAMISEDAFSDGFDAGVKERQDEIDKLRAELDQLKKDHKMVLEIGVEGQRRVNDQAWEKNKKLGAENQRYRTALEDIKKHDSVICWECDGGEWAIDIAKEAIGEKVGE